MKDYNELYRQRKKIWTLWTNWKQRWKPFIAEGYTPSNNTNERKAND